MQAPAMATGRAAPPAPRSTCCTQRRPRSAAAVAARRLAAPSSPFAAGTRAVAVAVARAGPRRARAASASAAASTDLADFIASGPIARASGLSAADAFLQLQQWNQLGDQLARQLSLEPATLTEAQRSRIYQYYLPTYFWVQQQLAAHRAKYAATGQTPPALVVGISAPQGCGKTTLVGQLQQLLTAGGCACASVSLDDYYLTGAEQDSLAAAHADNGLLRFRGNAGSHDLALARANLDALRAATSPTSRVAVPRYDKSLRGGRGDRAPEATWPTVAGPLQVVLLEGWMLGFRPVGAEAAAAVDPQLVAVDRFLGAYPAAMEDKADAWIVVRVEEPRWVFDWRRQAEVEMRAAGKAGLTDAQVEDFVARFMPAYKAYLPGLYARGPTGKEAAPRLVLSVDSTRRLVAAQRVD